MHPQAEIDDFTRLGDRLVAIGREFYSRGWVFGTSGNFSAVVSRDPMRVAITSSGVHKGALTPDHLLQVDAEGTVVHGAGRPSAETKLHLAVLRLRPAEAVLHTHSVWSTILSDTYASDRGVWIKGYEMLKGLEGVNTHEHSEWIPIIENSQDADELARRIDETLAGNPGVHGFLLRRHGFYTWGRTIDEAQRHVEIMEFLMEVTGRTMPGGNARP